MGTDLKLAHKIQSAAQKWLDAEYGEQATYHPQLDYLTVLAVITVLLGNEALAQEMVDAARGATP